MPEIHKNTNTINAIKLIGKLNVIEFLVNPEMTRAPRFYFGNKNAKYSKTYLKNLIDYAVTS